MAKFIDLSREIVDSMPVYPHDGPVRLYQNKHLAKDSYNAFRLETDMHSGTHIDAPMHMIDSKIYISEIPLERFAGKGCLLDGRGENIIVYKKEYRDIVAENDIVLMYTNHDSKYGQEDYFKSHPILHEDLADFFIEKNIKMLGIDSPSPDVYPFVIHKKLLGNNILLIENLTNLAKLKDIKSFHVFAFPLKIKAEASVARVLAYIDDGAVGKFPSNL